MDFGLLLSLSLIVLGAGAVALARWKLSTRAFAALAASTLVALGAGELFLRLRGLAEPGRPEWIEPLSMGDPSGPAYQPGGRLVYRYPSDPRGYFGSDLTLVGHVNSLGLRGAECRLEKTPGRTRVALLGDSFTLGIGVADADTLSANVERALGERSAEVLNFGVSASDTVEQVAYLLGYALRFEPDVVVIVFFLNDAERGSTMDYLTQQRALAGLRRYSHLLEGFVGALERGLLRASMLRHYREGYEETSPAWRTLRDELQRAKAALDEREIELLVAIHPVLMDLEEGAYPFADIHATIADFCVQAGIEVLDLLPALAGNPSDALWVHSTDRHPNEQANRETGEALARHLRRAGWVR